MTNKLDTDATMQASVVTVLGLQKVTQMTEVLLYFRYVGLCYNAMKDQLLSAPELRYAIPDL